MNNLFKKTKNVLYKETGVLKENVFFLMPLLANAIAAFTTVLASGKKLPSKEYFRASNRSI